MKVLQINSFFSVGGPPRIVNGIYDTLIEKGYQCKIAAAREKQYIPQDSIMIGSSYDAYINALKVRLLDDEGLSARRPTQKLIKDIENYNPDIVHLHNLHGYYINIGVLFDYLKAAQKPVVWTLHDCWAFTGHCAHFDLIKCEKWKTSCHDCPQKKEYPSSLILNMAQRNFRAKKEAFTGIDKMHIITPSRWLANLVHESFLGCYPIDVINNGIDLKNFIYTPSDIIERNNLKGKKIILGVAQNWAEKKGFEDFIELSKIIDNNYQVVMIGLTEDLMKRLPDNIMGIKRTNNIRELVEWYSASEIFVNLTYQDNFPTVNIEALACGTPVITYKTGGSPESIDISCGITVPQGNILAVKEAIEQISLCKNMRKACIDRAMQYERARKYNDYINLYKSLTGES